MFAFESITEEVQYLFRRMRHKLLFQIGLTDDPWQEKNDFIQDDVYSQNPHDPFDTLKRHRARSFDHFTGAGLYPL